MKMPVDSGRLTPAAAAEPGQRAKGEIRVVIGFLS